MAGVAAEERKQHVQELRKAHFHFGFETSTNYNSAQKQHLEMQKAAKVRPMSSFQPNETSKPPQAPKLQQNSHKFGDPHAPNIYESIAKTSYVRPQTAIERAALSEATKNDLRSHHFSLGFHPVDEPTEYKQKFTQQSAQSIGKVNPENIRKHNHDFGDRNSYYSTMYDQLHNKQYDPKLLGQGKSKDELQTQIQNIRKTNLVMGRDQVDYTTQTHAIHSQKTFQNNFVAPTQAIARDTHIQIGTDAPQYTSEAKGRFQGQQVTEAARLEEALKKDLRATHFKVGNEPRQFETTSQAYYKAPNNNTHQNPLNLEVQKTHFKIDDQSYKIDDPYTSAYKQQFAKGGAFAVRSDNPDRSKNVKLGDDVVNDRFTSEAANSFRDFKAPPARLDDETKKDLRSHHYQFGDDQNKYISQTKDVHVKQNGRPAQLTNHVKKDLRSSHFQLGDHKPDYVTSNKEIGSKQGPPNKLDPEVALRIKAHSQQTL